MVRRAVIAAACGAAALLVAAAGTPSWAAPRSCRSGETVARDVAVRVFRVDAGVYACASARGRPVVLTDAAGSGP